MKKEKKKGVRSERESVEVGSEVRRKNCIQQDLGRRR